MSHYKLGTCNKRRDIFVRSKGLQKIDSFAKLMHMDMIPWSVCYRSENAATLDPTTTAEAAISIFLMIYWPSIVGTRNACHVM